MHPPVTVELPLGGDHSAVVPSIAPGPPGTTAELWGALRLGLADYVRKNGFQRVLLGLSGGIDSALVAALAADALGAEQVEAVSMPTRYNSEGTRSDARLVAERLGIAFRELAIEDLRLAFEEALPGTSGLAAENLQARIRGVLLMTLSNQHGLLVLTTGNKSETAVGYSTLYGDMAGGFAPIKDVPKTLVFALARYLNEQAGRELIPASIIDRPPSASCATSSATISRCRPTSSSTRCSRPTSRTTSRPRRSPGAASRRSRWRSASRASSTWRSTSAARRRPASGCTTRPSAVTGACRSRTASAADRGAAAGCGRARRRRAPAGLVRTVPSVLVGQRRWPQFAKRFRVILFGKAPSPAITLHREEERAVVGTWLWAIFIVALIVVVGLFVATGIRRHRTEQLRRSFGPEYERTVVRAGDELAAEGELRERQARREELEVRPLDAAARKGFEDAWEETQAEFVDDPAAAIHDADRLIQRVMRDRGYPVEDFDDRAAIVSVDHPVVVERYRRAHDRDGECRRGARTGGAPSRDAGLSHRLRGTPRSRCGSRGRRGHGSDCALRPERVWPRTAERDVALSPGQCPGRHHSRPGVRDGCADEEGGRRGAGIRFRRIGGGKARGSELTHRRRNLSWPPGCGSS